MRSQIDVLNRFGRDMAGGGDAPNVPIWDMAVLIGASLLISTIFIVIWTQPTTVVSENDSTEVMTFHTGISTAKVSFDIEKHSDCDSESVTCEDVTVYLVPHDGNEIWDGDIPTNSRNLVLLDDGAESASVGFNDPIAQGEYRVVLDGEGTYLFEMTVNRTIPHEYVPALIGSLFVVWGVWRKTQESEV